ncbi:MAG: sigma-70 family RNA polymerase sigma factor [Proteobacteria bacterium]|nr:sigma-70 family RNA polymerase sigma factor [Pseudomonadota bacterium]MBU1610317.1 sigma-70 family RNA polymerase sigma factor [Pseudomonadota bacterium]
MNTSFDHIHAEFRDKILRYVRRYVGADAAEDVTQSVFLRISESLSSFEGRSSLGTWIYRIATNVALDHVRQQAAMEKNLALAVGNPLSSPGGTSSSGNQATPEDRMERQEMNDCIRHFVERLPGSYRVIITFRDILGFTNEEIAQRLGISQDAVRVRVHRARARLRTMFDANCEITGAGDERLFCDWNPQGPLLDEYKKIHKKT